MINNPPPFKGIDIRIIIPGKGRGFIIDGSGLQGNLVIAIHPSFPKDPPWILF